MREILQSYLRRLTNLSGNSRSVLLLRLMADQFIDLHLFNFSLNKPSFSIIQDIVGRKSKIPLCSIQDSRDESSNKLSARLKKLKKIDHLIFEERGAKDLYVGWPFVKGKFNDGTVSRCPLMFFPVSLAQDDSQWYLQLRKDVNITLNKSFLLAYAYFNEIKADEELLERVFDDFDKESKGFRTDLYELIKSHHLEIHFNQDNFKDELTHFKEYKKIDLEFDEKTGQLKLYPEAVLGIFPQAGSYLVPDYMHMLEMPKMTSMEEFFAERNLDEDDNKNGSYYPFLKRVREDQTFTPFEMDAYQENAIKAIKKGNSAVVQGPPGTGKSQLICNLIADYIARGKNVLLVSQKRAALDVVFERLKEKELNDFIGLLHDFKNDRKSIYQQLEGQIDRLEDYKSLNNSLDAIQLERNFLKTSRRIDQLEEELGEFKSALFDDRECGLSVKELYLTSDPQSTTITINLEYRYFHFQTLDRFKTSLQSYESYAQKFENENHPWIKRKSFAGYGVRERKIISTYLEDIIPYTKVLTAVTEKAIGKKVAFEDAVEIIEKKDRLRHLLSLLEEKKVYKALVHQLGTNRAGVTKAMLSEKEQAMMQFFKGNGPETSLDSADLGRFQESLERSLVARKSPLKWIRWKLFSKDKVFITRVLISNNLRSDKQGFATLVEKIDNRLNLEHSLTELKKGKSFAQYPDALQKIDIQNWFFFQKQALECRDILSDARHLQDYILPYSSDRETFVRQLTKLLEALVPIGEKISEWREYFSIPQLREIFSGYLSLESLTASLTRDFDSLCEFDQIRDAFSAEEKKVIDRLSDLEYHGSKDWVAIFDNSLKLAWIDHIEQKYPILRAVSSSKLEDMQSELQACVREKLRISNEIFLLKAREIVYKNVEYNRLNNSVTYRDIYHQVTKKRRIWPVRKLIANYPRETFDLIPCWLVSPESASAIFPMEKIFDLVIFDEASQCFVEQGIPAMYRGKQVVVAGDDKQLQPNDLYKVRWDDENTEDIVELEVDSLLNLANQYLMQVHLNGHYRSKKIDLIQFSNHHFYKDQLKMLPDFKEINNPEPAISYQNVQGLWEKQINREEADAVCLLVEVLLKKNPVVEIGIVTFNARQQMHLIERLEEFSIERKLNIPESLIIKNIENIQGDEKDVIIFSTIYAPDRYGKLNMQFGSLNLEGGENRLNVAITRAREKIYLITSILPQQLKVDDTKHLGPKLFKQYLQYAHDISNGKSKSLADVKQAFSEDWYLKTKIKDMDLSQPTSRGIEIDRSLPFVDLSVRSKDGYIAVIQTDDEHYHDAISIKESHVYLPFMLEAKNWKYRFVYSRQLWSDPEGLREKVNQTISRAIEK